MAKKRRTKDWDGNDRRVTPVLLIAGENVEANELLRRIFDSRGFDANTATGVEEALVMASNLVPRCVVISLSSSGMGSSMMLLDSLRQHEDPRVRNCRTVVVADTASNHNFAFQSGTDGYLVRPFHVDELHAAINEVLDVAPESRSQHRRDMLRK